MDKPQRSDETGGQREARHSSGAGEGAAIRSHADLFSATSQLIHNFHRAFQARLGLSGAEWRFMMLLLEHHEHLEQRHRMGNEGRDELLERIMSAGISQKEMQEVLGIDRAMVTRLAKQFEADGLVRRAPDPQDNRITILHLTEAGMRLHRDIPHKLATFWQEAVAGMSAPEIEGLHHALHHLSANLAAMAESPAANQASE